MNDIDRKIESLQKEIAVLERRKESGYEAILNADSLYSLYEDHMTLYDLEGNLAGVFINKTICKKFLTEEA